MNKQALVLYGKTEKDYKRWCKKNKLPHYKLATAQTYINKLKEDKENEQNHN